MKHYSQAFPTFKWIMAILSITFITLSIYGKPAFAHVKLVKSDPPNRATLNIAPKQIQLWFNEDIEGSFALISLLDANGKSVTDNNPELVPDDLRTLVLPLPKLVPGKYTVNFRIMSTDGHVVESDYKFTLKDTK